MDEEGKGQIFAFLPKVDQSVKDVEYLNVSQCKGHFEQKRQKQSSPLSVRQPELSWTDRRVRHYQASLTEVILRVQSLLSQAYQTFSWTWVSECPMAKSWEEGERIKKESMREQESVKGAVRSAESP